MPTAELLNRVWLFEALEQSDLERLATGAQFMTYQNGETIVEIGDPGHSLFVIVEGSVLVAYPGLASDVELARLGPGDFFGEMALLNDKPRSATVRAQGRVRAVQVGKFAFQNLVLEQPDVGLKIMDVLSRRVRTADEQIGVMAEQSQRDLLTHLLNRRALQERLVEECDRYRRYGAPFSLVLLDLDRFKDINELFGQVVGDNTLAWVGRLLSEHTRAADVAFRIAGEEFGLLCPAIQGSQARVVAQRLVELVAQARPPVGFELKVTMSAGVACNLDHGSQPDDLLRAAERALLRAKAEGRNRVVQEEAAVT